MVLPFISACIIARDEETQLPALLDSLSGRVDEILLLDTGSVDRTIEIAQSRGVRVEHFTWCDDFSAARNASIRAARGRWCLIIDCDERLHVGTDLRGALQQFERDSGNCWPLLFGRCSVIDRDLDETPRGVHRQFRLFPRHPALYYESPVHNRLTVDPELMRQEMRVLDFSNDQLHLIHYGYAPEIMHSKQKSDRAFRLLTKALLEKDDPLNRFYLGREFFHVGDWAKAVEHLQKASQELEVSSSLLEKQHWPQVLYYLTQAQRSRGDLEAAQKTIRKACVVFPNNADLCWLEGVVFLEDDDPYAAASRFQDASVLFDQSEYEPTVFLQKWQVLFNLGQAWAAIGDEPKARNAFQGAVDAGMPDPELVDDLLDMRPTGGRVVAGMATIPSRTVQLELAVRSLLPQVDSLVVYLNNFGDAPTPAVLADPKVLVLRSESAQGDLRDVGKFAAWAQSADFYLSVDDDIIYPPNFVTQLVKASLELGEAAAVGVHGAMLNQPIQSYFRDRLVHHCRATLETLEQVHVVGTGTLLLPRAVVAQLDYALLHGYAGAADLGLSLLLAAAGVPRYIIPRRADWVQPLLVEDSLFAEFVHNDAWQTCIAHQIVCIDGE